MKRLFFALNATVPLEKSFAPFLKKIRIGADQREVSVRWTPPENYHITVTFLGETPDENIPELKKTLEQVCTQFASFDLKIEDISGFSNEHDARVIYLGVQNKRYLNEFKQALDQALEQNNLLTHVDKRGFVPHLTIGRLRNPKSIKDLISPLKRKSFGKLKVTEIVLYESKLEGVYPVYTPVFRVQLTGQPEQHIDI
jgi:2'-5' RNA ligase